MIDEDLYGKEGKEVNHPPHYNTGKIEVIDYIDDKQLSFCLGNVIKYISRAGHKEGNSALQDLRKAKWYLAHEIEKLEKMEGK